MATKLKPLKDEKDIKAVPVTEPVLIEIAPPPTGREPDKPQPVEVKANVQPPVKVEIPSEDDGVAKLQKELKTLKAAEEKRTEEIARLTRERQEAIRHAQERDRELAQSRTENDRATFDHVNSALSGAQSEQAAAEAEWAAASRSDDLAAMAKAQSKIARAAAKILNYEAAAAELDERRKQSPQQQQYQQAPVDIVTAVQTNPGLLPKEREWLLAHQEVLVDQNRGKELEVAYIRATRAGHSRGTDAYFQFLDKELGYAKSQAETTESEEESESIMAAPVSRESGVPSSGSSNGGQVALTPEQRNLARNMGITDVQYAIQVLRMQQDKKENPERYSLNRG